MPTKNENTVTTILGLDTFLLESPNHCPIIALIMDNDRAMIGQFKQGRQLFGLSLMRK